MLRQLRISRRRWFVLLAVFAMLLLALIIYWVNRSTVTATTTSHSKVSAPDQQIVAASSGDDASTITATQPSAKKTGESSAKIADDMQEICGYGVAKKSEDEEPPQLKKIEEDAQKILFRAIDQLIASSSEQDLALGLWLRVQMTKQQAVRPYYTPACVDNESCSQGSNAAELQAIQSTIAPLAVLGARSSDPAVYALALRACTQRRDINCDGINYAGWLAREPDNAVPLLAMASALPAENVSERSRLVGRAIALPRYEMHLPKINRLLELPLIKEQPPVLEMAINGLVAMESYMIEGSTHTVISRHCGSDSVASENKQRDCLALATVFEKNGTTIYSQLMAFVASRGAGVAEIQRSEKFSRIRELSSFHTSEFNLDNMYACENVKRSNEIMRDNFRLGEVAAVRARMVASKQAKIDSSKK
jgi:hypothetical protein